MNSNKRNTTNGEDPENLGYELSMFLLHLGAFIFLGCILLYDRSIARGEYRNAILVVHAAVFIIWIPFLVNHGWKTYKSRKQRKEQGQYIEKDEE